MDDIKVFDKIIPQGYADAIEEDLLDPEFPWYYVDDVTNPNYGNNSGLTHCPFNFGKGALEYYPFLKPLVYAIAEANGRPLEKLFRIRIGFLPKNDQPEYEYNTPHVDFLWEHFTACYYVNDSDGDTVLFDKNLDEMGHNLTDQLLREYVARTEFTPVQRVSPKKGRVVIFDGKRFHASTKPRNHQRRLVITINFI
jgi:hypothetical protein